MIYLYYSMAFVVLFLIGTIIGMFYPMMKREQKYKEYWHKCPECGEKMSASETIPVFGFLKNGGYCKKHKKSLIKNILFSLTFSLFGIIPLIVLGFSLQGICYSLVTCMLIYCFFTDSTTMVMPDFAHIVVGIIAICLMVYSGTYKDCIIGAFALSIPMFLICLSGCAGFADVKFLFATGLLLGWKNILLAFFIAVIIGLIEVIIMKIKNSESTTWKKRIAFGPVLCIGVYASMLFGNFILTNYFSLF